MTERFPYIEIDVVDSSDTVDVLEAGATRVPLVHGAGGAIMIDDFAVELDG